MESSSPPRELHPLEVKVLLRYGAADTVSSTTLTNDLGYNLGQANQALSWLSAKGFLREARRVERVFYEITELGRECMEKGTYEARIVALLASEGPLALPELARKLGIEAKDVGSAFGGLSKDKVLAMDAEKRAAVAPGGAAIQEAREAALQGLLRRSAQAPLDESALTADEKTLAGSQAKKRAASGSLFRVAGREELFFTLAPAGAAAGDALRKTGATGQETGALTAELLRSGGWKNARFRRYNIDVPPTRVPAGRSNPYSAFLEGLKNKLSSLGFEEFDGPLVETEFWNGDALFMPQFHSARDIHDVYHIKSPTHAKEIEQPWLDQVAATHENGWKTGSRGWRYDFDRTFTKRLILRSQGSRASPCRGRR